MPEAATRPPTRRTLPKPVAQLSLICYGVVYLRSEEEAAQWDAYVRARGERYNGGYLGGMPCGREKGRDIVDPVHGPLFAVTVA